MKKTGADIIWPRILAFAAVMLAALPILSGIGWYWGSAETIVTREELDRFDFSSGTGQIDRKLFDFYPEKLYSPEELEQGGKTAAPSNTPERKTVRFATCRLVLRLKKGCTYGINMDSATYAHKVWVNGVLLSSVGTVSDREASFEPKTRNETIYFTAGDAPTEIVMQRANFVHAEGDFFEATLGPADRITRLVQLRLLHAGLILGTMIMASLSLFSTFLFFPGRKQYLWFALASFCVAIRTSFVRPKPIMVLFPDLNWYFGHKLECCSLLAAALFLLLFYNTVFRGYVPPAVRRPGYALCGAGLLLYAAFPSAVYSRANQAVIYILGAYMLVFLGFFLVGAIRRRSDFARTPNLLLMAGSVVAVLFGLADAFRYRRIADANFGQTGMLIFVFVSALSLLLELRRTEAALNEATEREEEMKRKNQTLTQLSLIRSEFMAYLGHEMKTPLTVMSSYAGLTRMQIVGNAVDTDTLDNLDVIQKEAVRLANMVDQIKDVSTRRERQLTLTETDVRELLQQAARFCAPICARNGNTVRVDAPERPTRAMLARENILQVLYNLIINANRHSRETEITLKAEEHGEKMQISVIDRGEGMSSEALSHAFERGFSGDKSSGLGLALCREIVEDHGGTISIFSEPGKGTEVRFTLAAEKREQT